MAVGPISRKPSYPPIKKPAYTPPPPPPERREAVPGVRTPTDQLNAQSASKALGSLAVAGSAAIAEAPPPDDDFGFAPAAPTLAIGTNGPEVASMQQRLLDAGFDPGPIDGIFGPLTEGAVKSFQEAAGLPADGVASPELFAVLDQLENPTAPAPQAEVPAQTPVPTTAETTVPAPTGQPPAFGSPEVQATLARLPDPAQDPEVFLFAVNRATADFQNRLTNGQSSNDPTVVSQDLQMLATAFSAAGPAGEAQARLLGTLAQLTSVPGVPPTFQQELIRSFTNDGGNVGNIEAAIQSVRNIEDPELTQALYNTIAASVPLAVAASPESDKAALEARGQIAVVLGDPNVSPDVRRRLGQGMNNDDDAKDFAKAIKDANTKEDFTALLAFQLANAERLQGESALDSAAMAQGLQFVATNFEALSENGVGNRMSDVFDALMGDDAEKLFTTLREVDDLASDGQKDLLKEFGNLVGIQDRVDELF